MKKFLTLFMMLLAVQLSANAQRILGKNHAMKQVKVGAYVCPQNGAMPTLPERLLTV